jgi:hypothetical protein
MEAELTFSCSISRFAIAVLIWWSILPADLYVIFKSLTTWQAEYPALSFKKFLITLNHFLVGICVVSKIVPFNGKNELLQWEQWKTLSLSITVFSSGNLRSNSSSVIALTVLSDLLVIACLFSFFQIF